MNIRLHGTKGECAVAVHSIQEVLTVLSVSEPYPDRGTSILVRVYLDVRIPGGEDGWRLQGGHSRVSQLQQNGSGSAGEGDGKSAEQAG